MEPRGRRPIGKMHRVTSSLATTAGAPSSCVAVAEWCRPRPRAARLLARLGGLNCERDLISSTALGLIQGSVCRREQFGLGFAFSSNLHAEADRDGNVSHSGGHRAVRNGGPQTLIQYARAILSSVLGEHHELIPAMAAQDVVPTQVAPNDTH